MRFFNLSHNEKTQEFDYPVIVCQNKKLTKKEFNDFENIINKYKFWEKKTYDLEPICTDGFGIVFQALHNGDYRNYSNGNCAGQNEYLNVLYTEIKKLLKLY
ncbi:hypothetical protein [Chryseobacterium indoltheticum]|uniref:hypothetical protein n=1 Tax=Chryseobacterium indoltheticum TaxID=254 RepID=UPI003F49AC3E